MADDVTQDATNTPKFDELATSIAGQVFDPKNMGNLERAVGNALQSAIVNAIGALIVSAGAVGTAIGKVVEGGEKVAAPILAPLLATAVQSMLGIEVDAATLARVSDAGARQELGRAAGISILSALEGDGGELQPSREPAERLVGMLAHLAIDGWAETTIIEWLLSLSGMVHNLEGLTKLVPDLVQATGIDELGRMAFRPLGLVTISKPLEWQAHKTYRPTLLSPAEAARQVARGVWSERQAAEECARQGYSDDRIEALFTAADKYLTLDEAYVLQRNGVWSREDIMLQLRAQGWPEESARRAMIAYESKRLDALRDNSLGALTHAYTNRQISDHEFQVLLRTIVLDEAEQAATLTATTTMRALNIATLSRGDVERAVKIGVLGMVDYRAALTREGYSDDDSLVLEILLRSEIDKEFKVEKARAAAIAERAAAQAARDAAALERKKQVDAERALHRRGSLADLNRAVVRGLVPIDRLVEVLNQEYDPDTVAILVRLAESDRQTYLEQQHAAADAKQRALTRSIDVGALEQGVLEHIVTLADFRRRLEQLKFSPADADIITATLGARLADLTAAKAQHDAAVAAAKIKSIDLSKFELLVRRGHRSLADYDALLRSLGFDDASRAAMRELLELLIADDAAAAATRRPPTTPDAATGLTLEQIRRGVILGLVPESVYEQFLIQHNFTSDAQALLLAELRTDVAAAEDARQRRAAADQARATPALPLATVARAARLGIVSPAVYQARLVSDGFSADDVALEMDLLVHEIADVQAARGVAAAADQANAGKGLSLAELGIAVKRQLKHLEDYRARATELGLSADAVTTLVRVLGDELADTEAAKARRAEIAGQLTAKGISLADRDAAVKEGTLSFADYTAGLERDGYAAEDAELLTALLVDEIAAVSA